MISPLNSLEIISRLVSSLTSLSIASLGVSPASICPPTPIYLPLLKSFFFLLRYSNKNSSPRMR